MWPSLPFATDSNDSRRAGQGCSYVPIVSRSTHPANVGWAGLTGRLETQLDVVCDSHGVDPADSVAYLCGNPEMIAAATGILAARGFAPEAMVCEQYWPIV